MAPLRVPLAALSLLAATACAHRSSGGDVGDRQPASLASVDAAALQGDEREALRRLERIPPDRLSERDRARRACLLRTFVERAPAAPEVMGAFAPEVAAIYRSYWTRVLLREATPEEGAAQLGARLRDLLGRAGRPPSASATLDDLTEALEPVLRADGYHSIRGVTLPFYELILWGRETPRTYDVSLPEGTIPVKVVFMDGFAVRGWSGFATCGEAFAGGWTTDDALFCVADAYDTGSETFSVSYLGHEAQHFLDGRRFPAMEQPELEYRAKLTELALARTTTRALLARFAEGMGQDRSVPHAHANRRVVEALSRALLGREAPVVEAAAWDRIPAERLSQSARDVLIEDTRARQAPAGRP